MEKIKAQHPLIKDGWHPVDYKKTATMTMLLALKARANCYGSIRQKVHDDCSIPANYNQSRVSPQTWPAVFSALEKPGMDE